MNRPLTHNYVDVPGYMGDYVDASAQNQFGAAEEKPRVPWEMLIFGAAVVYFITRPKARKNPRVRKKDRRAYKADKDYRASFEPGKIAGMSYGQLQKKARSMGLKTTGSFEQLKRRIRSKKLRIAAARKGWASAASRKAWRTRKKK